MAVNIPQPPRLTGEAQNDLAAMSVYLGDLYRAFVVDGLLAGAAPTVSFTDLPDPASTSLATAQQTANDAYIAAVAAQAIADNALARVVEFGEVTISNTATTAVYTFAEAFEDTDYLVFAVPKTFTGSPSIDAFVKEAETRATDDVTIEVNTAPGAGTSVTFNILILQVA